MYLIFQRDYSNSSELFIFFIKIFYFHDVFIKIKTFTIDRIIFNEKNMH